MSLSMVNGFSTRDMPINTEHRQGWRFVGFGVLYRYKAMLIKLIKSIFDSFTFKEYKKQVEYWNNEMDQARKNGDWHYYDFCAFELHSVCVNGGPTGAIYPEHLRRQNLD